MSTRIYKVTDGVCHRLIRAHTKTGAIHHAAKAIYTAKVATQDDLVDCLVTNDIAVEDATEEEVAP